MGEISRKLVVEIVGDASSLDRTFKKASNSSKEFDRSMGRTTRGAIAGTGAFKSLGRQVAFTSAGFIGGATLGAVLAQSISGASDLEQQISKTNVVFGKSAAEVEAWSKTLAGAFGLSTREALTLASTFGALFAPLGIVGKTAADQSQRLVELGADLASFYNTTVQDALDAIQSGLVGQARPLRRYGVLLDAARVQQEALSESGKKHVQSLTNQEKVLARITLLFKDSKKAQGDFARTSDQAAQQAKILKANVSNLSDELGATMLPTLNKVVTALNEFAQAASGGAVEGPVRGQGVETSLVPALAKRIAAYKKAGLQGKEILRLLHAQLGVAEKEGAEVTRLRKLGLIKGPPVFPHSRIADELIAEAFAFDRDKKLRDRIRAQAREARKAADADTPTVVSPGRRKANEAVRQQIQDEAQLAVDRTQLTKGLGDDLAALEKLNALLKRRIKGHHDSLSLQRDQLNVQLQINDLLSRQADARKASREAAKKAAEDARQAALDARNARQFRILGFGPTGEDIIPGVKALKSQLRSVMDAIEGTFLDTGKTRNRINSIRQVLAAGVGHISNDVRARIKQLLDDLKAQLKQSSVDVTKFQQSARGQFGLAGAHGGATGGVVITGPVHIHGVQNVKQMENELARRSKQRAHARRSTR